MAARGLIALLDDMAKLLDDVAAMTKVAAKKTAGVVGDDVALNAKMLLGMSSKREIPVIWEVAKKSLLNKAILVPCALGISAVVPAAITPLLMLGGAYLCYEGVEKTLHKLFHKHDEDKHGETHLKELLTKTPDEIAAEHAAHERKIIKSAAFTDMILSAEIVAIALGSMAAAPLLTQAVALSTIGLGMTVGVYGMAAAIVKIDDAGLWLAAREGTSKAIDAVRAAGRGIVAVSPYLMKALSFVGTAAMFLVGGEILMHGIPGAESLVHNIAHAAHGLPYVGGLAEVLAPTVLAMAGGVVAGAVALGVVTPVLKGMQAVRARLGGGQKPVAQTQVTATPGSDDHAPHYDSDISAPSQKKTLPESASAALDRAAAMPATPGDSVPAVPAGQEHTPKAPESRPS